MKGKMYKLPSLRGVMTIEQFIIDLKSEARGEVAGTIKYISNPPGNHPPEHLANLSKWYCGLSEEDQSIARMAMEYSAEGALFALLNVLDGVYDLPSNKGGKFELYFVRENERMRLNDPEGDLLYDIFNNTP